MHWKFLVYYLAYFDWAVGYDWNPDRVWTGFADWVPIWAVAGLMIETTPLS